MTAPSPLARRRAWLLALIAGVSGVLYALSFSAIQAVSGPDGTALLRYHPVFFGLLFGLYLVGVWLSWSAGPRAALLVIAAGMLFRVLGLPTPVLLSSDPYRYLWDGRVQMAGINPYRHPPRAEALASLRDPEIYPRINRPWGATIYPPGAELLFAGLAWNAPDRIWALRLFVILCELASMLALGALLRRLQLPEGRVVVYAWAPLAIFEFAQAGHIDAALIPRSCWRCLPGSTGGLAWPVRCWAQQLS